MDNTPKHHFYYMARLEQLESGHWYASANELFDGTMELLNTGGVGPGLEQIFGGLEELRNNSLAIEWEDFAMTEALSHPVREFLHQDPLTLQAYSKPRGFNGDAVVHDMIYGLAEHGMMTSLVGRDIYEYCRNRPFASAIRERCAELASIIDTIAETVERPKVLAVGSGNFREANHSMALQSGRIAEIIAIEQDLECVSAMERKMYRLNVRPVHGTTWSLLTGRLSFSGLDFIYSADTISYLSQSTARRLLSTLFSMLAPGGQLVFASLDPSLPDIGYLEAFMDWRMIYRTPDQLRDLLATVDARALAECEVSVRQNGCMNYLHLIRS